MYNLHAKKKYYPAMNANISQNLPKNTVVYCLVWKAGLYCSMYF